MCGIAGIIGHVPDIETHIERMSRAIAHRGPDDEGCQVWPAVGAPQTAFAHRRLSIIDLSAAGRQPMTSADGRYSIIFNGEIYNFLEIRKELIAEGSQFRTNTDTEVLLELYRKRGAACLQPLRGMFAFAIHDGETGEVFAARDRLGIKPFYYYASAGRFLFASELRALLASGLVPRVLDPLALNSYLSFGAVQEPLTIIEQARTLPPAHYIEVGRDGAIKNLARYWALPAARHDIEHREAVAETRARLEESVRLHLMADVPLGLFLSSGIDSSAIAAMMSKHAAGRVKTFTVCFGEHEFSERHLAAHVAEKWDTAHTEIVLSEQEMLASLPQATADIDQPSIDGINTWIISRATRQAGITVALSGLGGDELFGGYPSFHRALRLQRFNSSLGRLHPKMRGQVAGLTMKVMGNSLRGQKLASAISAGNDLLFSYAGMRGLFAKTSRQRLTERRAACRIEMPYDIPEETLALVAAHNANGDVFNRISQYELNLYTANMLLRDTDAMSMASALEVRVPLLDHKLLEWVYALPGQTKLGQRPKALLVDALGADLLPEVANKEKKGFLLPFERWLHTALRPYVALVLSDTAAVKQAGLNHDAVMDVARSFAANSRSTSWSRVWSLVVLVGWCRQHGVEMAG